MQWEVSGVDCETGVDKKIVLDADTEASAVRRGNRRGLMVERASVVRGVPPLPAKPQAPLRVIATSPTERFEVEHQWRGPMPPKPKVPFFKLTSVKLDYVAIQRLKLVLEDMDVHQLRAEITDLPEALSLADVADAAEKKWGCRVKKIVVVDKFWKEIEKLGLLEKVVGVIAIGELLG